MNLHQLNHLSEQQASQAFRQCCTASAWVKLLVDNRPYARQQDLTDAANEYWLGLSEQDYLQAFDGHPKIGDVSSLIAKYADTKTLAASEQAGMNTANEQTVMALARGNDDYLNKFGFIFIVCASGKTASQMNELLQQRLRNDRDTELANAAEQQRKIFIIRLYKLMSEEIK